MRLKKLIALQATALKIPGYITALSVYKLFHVFS